jgi:class 3 adenylate cyclase
MRVPDVRYAKSGEVHVAYQVIGEGPIDLVFAPGRVSHLEVYWENPDLAAFFTDVATFARLILFDKRGTGLSDRGVGVATLEDRMDDIRAIMDAAGSSKATVFGLSEGATMAILFAATYPEKTAGLIAFGGFAKGAWAPDYPWGRKAAAFAEGIEAIERDWNAATTEWATTLAPSRAGDAGFREWVGRLTRAGVTPGDEIARRKMNRVMDVRSVLPAIRVPTLVIHPSDDKMIAVDEGRYLAEHIPGARLIEYPSPDHLFVANPGSRQFVTREVRSFVQGLHSTPESDRILTTVLFTDIVGSTRRAVELGDQAWGRLLGEHFSLSQAEVARFRGREIKRTGDGILAIFDGPTRAVRCACSIRDKVRSLGLEIRAGLHTGECVLKGIDIEGVAVHTAARVCEAAEGGSVMVSGTVRDLSAGSDVRFGEWKSLPLKGLDGDTRLYIVQAA